MSVNTFWDCNICLCPDFHIAGKFPDFCHLVTSPGHGSGTSKFHESGRPAGNILTRISTSSEEHSLCALLNFSMCWVLSQQPHCKYSPKGLQGRKNATGMAPGTIKLGENTLM